MKPTKLSNSNKKSVKFNWPTVIFLLIMTGIPGIPGFFIFAAVLLGADQVGQVSSMINPLYFDKPLAIIIHAGSGFLFFLSVPFQFSGALRLKRPKLHKKAGYIAFVSGCILGLSGVWMHHFLNGGILDVRYVSLSIQVVCLCAAFIIAIKHILARNIQCHRRWMSRAIAIALSPVSLIFIEEALVLVLGNDAQNIENLIQVLHNFGNLIGMITNLLVVEYFINKPTWTGRSSNQVKI